MRLTDIYSLYLCSSSCSFSRY